MITASPGRRLPAAARASVALRISDLICSAKALPSMIFALMLSAQVGIRYCRMSGGLRMMRGPSAAG